MLWDGRMLARPDGKPPSASEVMRATGAVQVDAARLLIRAEGPVSREQINTILSGMDTAPGVQLVHSKGDRELMRFRTSEVLTETTLRAAFSRPEPGVFREGGDREAFGAVMFDEANKAVIALSSAANFDTLMEEVGHVFRRHLSKEQEAAAGGWAGAQLQPDGTWKWGRQAEEVFARGFVDWLREGALPPSDATGTVFERMKRWLRTIYAGLRSQLNPEVRRVFEEIILSDDAPQVLAFDAAREDLQDTNDAHFTDEDGGRLHAHRRKDGSWYADALDSEGNRRLRREHPDVDSLAREVGGVRTIETPVPMGNARMRMERPQDTAARARDAELRTETDDMTLSELQQASESEASVLYQEGEQQPAPAEQPQQLTPEQLYRQRIEQLKRGRRTQAARASGREQGRQEARETTARSYERRDAVRFARKRIREVQRSLQEVLRETRTMPSEVREFLEPLLKGLKLTRVGRTATKRLEADTGQVDMLRILAVLRMLLKDAGELPPGLLTDSDKKFEDMTLLEIEKLHNTVRFVVHHTRAAQAALRKGHQQRAAIAAKNIVGELRRVPPSSMPGGLRALGQVLGERPGFLLERVGGGLRSETYQTLYAAVEQGGVKQRAVAGDAMRQFEEDVRAAGIEQTQGKRFFWLGERIKAPEWAEAIHKRWTRGELMSLALMWNDPYARRNLIYREMWEAEREARRLRGKEVDPDEEPPPHGIVFYESGAQGTTPHPLTTKQVRELIGLLSDEDRRFIGTPVRKLFDDLYEQLNAVFREKYGYDLEQAPSYFPIQVASVEVPDDYDAASAFENYLRNPGDRTSKPFQGMVKWRTGAVKPMVLRPLSEALNSAVNHASGYIGLEMPLTDAGRIMATNAVTATMRERFGSDLPGVVDRYLRDMAGRGEPMDGLDRLLTALRHNVSVGALGLNPKVAASQAFSYGLGQIHMPAKYLFRGISDMASPARAREILETHTRMSPNFAARTDRSFDPDVARGSGQRLLPPTKSTLGRRHEQAANLFMLGISRVDRGTVGRLMQAAVQHATADAFEGKTKMTADMKGLLGVTVEQAQARSVEERNALAYRWADWVTAQTQPSNLSENLSHFARGKWTKLFTSFSGYTNVAFNALRRSLVMARRANFQDAEANRAAAVAAIQILFVSNLGVALLGQAAAWLTGREPEPLWKGAVGGVLSLIFGLRDIGYFMLHGGRGGVEIPMMGAVNDLARAGLAIEKAVARGDSEAAGRAIERTSAGLLRVLGVPYWTPKNYVGGIAEHLD